MGKKTLKGLRWLLIKHQENLDESKDERPRLQDLLNLNESLSIAYYLKEDLGQIRQQSGKAIAGRFLKDWCVRASGIKVMQTMAKKLQRHRTGIFDSYNFSIHAIMKCANTRGSEFRSGLRGWIGRGILYRPVLRIGRGRN